jgi:hypothetical protein
MPFRSVGDGIATLNLFLTGVRYRLFPARRAVVSSAQNSS